MENPLDAALRALFSPEEGSEPAEKPAMAVLLVLESGAEFGLVLQDERACWARRHEGVTLVFSEATAKHFVEWLEHGRRDLEARIETTAEEMGLPGLETVLSLPVFVFVRALLAGPSVYFVYQAMRWLQPTDLRELREELKTIAENPEWPDHVRDLAEHLVVPAH